MRILLALTALVACAGPARAPIDDVPGIATPSVYDLPARLLDRHGASVGLDVGRGHPVLVSMFYTSCPAACPMLIARIQALEAALTPDRRADLRVVLVSLDPARDTPQVLAKLADDSGMDARWILLTADADTVRRVAAVLDFRYHERPDGDFDHASTLILLDALGRPIATADDPRATALLSKLSEE